MATTEITQSDIQTVESALDQESEAKQKAIVATTTSFSGWLSRSVTYVWNKLVIAAKATHKVVEKAQPYINLWTAVRGWVGV